MNACREYRGPRHGFGYGRPRFDGQQVLLHRWMVETVEGRPLAPGEVVRHKCDNPPCFLYEHLERGTQADNLNDRYERKGHHNSLKTTCPRGHAYDYVEPSGGRRCRRCSWGVSA